MIVRLLLSKFGIEFKCNVRKLPGTPDIVCHDISIVFMIHGCFWHNHECRKGKLPKTNPEYWKTKFERNAKRDAKVESKLTRIGFKVVTIWECETENLARLAATIRNHLAA